MILIRKDAKFKLEKLFQIMVEILEVDIDKIALNTSRDMLEEWDSLSHIQIIVEVESSFNIKIPIEEINQINLVGDFIRYIKE